MVVNTGVVGANGLDTGTLAASTWYYLYAITNAAGSTVQGLMSTSATAPALPATFTQFRLISTYRTDGSVHFLLQNQYDDMVYYVTGGSVLSNGTNTTATAVSNSSFVPPITREIKILININVNLSGNGQSSVQTQITGTTGFILRTSTSFVSPTSAGNNVEFMQIVNSSQQFDYKCSGGVITAGGINIYVVGYRLSL